MELCTELCEHGDSRGKVSDERAAVGRVRLAVLGGHGNESDFLTLGVRLGVNQPLVQLQNLTGSLRQLGTIRRLGKCVHIHRARNAFRFCNDIHNCYLLFSYVLLCVSVRLLGTLAKTCCFLSSDFLFVNDLSSIKPLLCSHCECLDGARQAGDSDWLDIGLFPNLIDRLHGLSGVRESTIQNDRIVRHFKGGAVDNLQRNGGDGRLAGNVILAHNVFSFLF
nr:MAG TPA: hypothetical protein [Caudoviricetes sp.]